jgi:hypothetical protein
MSRHERFVTAMFAFGFLLCWPTGGVRVHDIALGNSRDWVIA